VRTSVFRLARDGWLARTAHGRESRYRLTADGARRFDEAYRRIYARPGDDWHGQWEIVLVNGIPPARRARLRDELVWSGFGELGNGAFVRPHEPSRPLPAILSDRKATTALAQDYEGQTPIAERTADAWKVAALADEYRHFLARFGAVIERFRGGGDAEQCFVVRTMLIHAYRRVLLRDPLLPAALLPLDWPGAAAYALCRDFYRLTHRRAERHLADTLSRDGAPWPPANAGFYERFGGL
jgi:phenylacetic acid degradation operon negative regulatory protein